MRGSELLVPYEFIGRDYAITDYEAALANYNYAAYACRELRLLRGLNTVPAAEVQAAVHAYRVCRERLLDVRQYVGRASGHPELPKLPEGFPDLVVAP